MYTFSCGVVYFGGGFWLVGFVVGVFVRVSFPFPPSLHFHSLHKCGCSLPENFPPLETTFLNLTDYPSTSRIVGAVQTNWELHDNISLYQYSTGHSKISAAWNNKY